MELLRPGEVWTRAVVAAERHLVPALRLAKSGFSSISTWEQSAAIDSALASSHSVCEATGKGR